LEKRLEELEVEIRTLRGRIGEVDAKRRAVKKLIDDCDEQSKAPKESAGAPDLRERKQRIISRLTNQPRTASQLSASFGTNAARIRVADLKPILELMEREGTIVCGERGIWRTVSRPVPKATI